MASDFAQEYLAICRERNVEPNDGLMKCLQRYVTNLPIFAYEE